MEAERKVGVWDFSEKCLIKKHVISVVVRSDCWGTVSWMMEICARNVPKSFPPGLKTGAAALWRISENSLPIGKRTGKK